MRTPLRLSSKKLNGAKRHEPSPRTAGHMAETARKIKPSEACFRADANLARRAIAGERSQCSRSPWELAAGGPSPVKLTYLTPSVRARAGGRRPGDVDTLTPAIRCRAAGRVPANLTKLAHAIRFRAAAPKRSRFGSETPRRFPVKFTKFMVSMRFPPAGPRGLGRRYWTPDPLSGVPGWGLGSFEVSASLGQES